MYGLIQSTTTDCTCPSSAILKERQNDNKIKLNQMKVIFFQNQYEDKHVLSVNEPEASSPIATEPWRRMIGILGM